MMKTYNSALTAIALAMLVVLNGCSGEADEAKKLGFASVEEMKEIHAKGWHTKERYDDDAAIQLGYKSASDMKLSLEKRRQEEERIRIAKEKEEKERAIEEKARAEAAKNRAAAMATDCANYKVSRIAAYTTVADWDFICTDMIKTDTYSSLNLRTFFDHSTGECMLNVRVSGIKNGTSKTCDKTKVVDKVENGMVMYTKP